MANLNLNKTILGGRLVSDPELKQTTSGISVTQFTLAVNRRFSKEGEQSTDFITCVAWRQTAEFICKYFRKGSSLCVSGSIQTRTWTDSNNQKRYATEVVIDEAMFVDSKNEGGQPTAASPEPFNAPQGYTEMSNEEDLPF